ncbi:hypothetical protein H9Q70_000512 [Fusarium xylarioides]|nr:hypothetical protein H9Q70_000512 [Fusarium xylarioides]KAG5779562.1 hypothetical protein H9Q73_006785 [Fusarium xylarioides]
MSQNHNSSISDWLKRIPASPSAQKISPPRLQKRQYPPSPSMSSASAKKRKKAGSDIIWSQKIPPPLPQTPGSRVRDPFVDEDATPRAPTDTTSTSGVSTSGRSSPTKRLNELALDPKGVDFREFTTVDYPSQVFTALWSISQLARGNRVISPEMRADIERAVEKKEGEWFRFVDELCYCDDNDQRLQWGETPSARAVTKILQKARTSATDGDLEYSWNMEVHQAVLDLALRDLRDHVEGDRVNFKFCPSARIMIEYQPGTVPESKMIDFCAVIEPEAESLAGIDRLRKVLPMTSTNHTSHNPLLKKPLCLAIEIKPPGEKWNTARLQVGVWLAAQWTLLARLVSDADGSFEGLDFLPGIIVQGHEWYFVASGREGTKAVLWTMKGFGATSDVIGIYKIVSVLQYLANWAETVYWPWFKKNALRVERREEASQDDM